MHMRSPRRLFCNLILAALIGWSSNLFGELVSMTLQPGQFPNPSAVSVFVDAGLLGDDEVTSSISGELQLELLPSAVNPTSARIVELAAQVDDAIDFRVGGGLLLPTVTVNVAPEELQLNLTEPGVAGQIDRGTFSQLDNLVTVEGLVETSIQTEPFDLTEFDAMPIDFEDVEIAIDGREISVATFLLTQMEIPVDIGILTLNIGLEIDGAVEAKGVIPPANYRWTGASGDTYSDTQHWLRGAVPDTASIPTNIDSLTLQSTLDLDGNREVASVMISESASLLNGTLSVNNSLEIANAANLFLGETATLRSEAQPALEISGGGRLVVEGNVASAVTLADGTIAAGGGEVQSVDISADGTLELSTASLLTGSSISFQPGSELQIGGPSFEVGEFQLADAQVVLDGLFLNDTGQASEPSILVNDEQLFLATPANGRTAFADDDHFLGHTGDGIFTSVTYRPADGIVLVNEQAILGDSDNDGVVGFQDFLRLSANFGDPGDWTSGDFDGDGIVQFADFLILSRGFGGPSPAAQASVPEPNALTIAGLLSCLIAVKSRQRRR